MKRTPFLVILGVILLLVVGSLSGYAYFQKQKLSDELTGVDITLANAKKDLLQLENQNVLQAINAKKTVADITEDALKWSEVIKAIRATVPAKGDDHLVNILTYSGSKNNDISLTLKTLPDSEDGYMDVADLIEAFDDSREFAGSFVPSISAGTNDEGDEVLSFSLSTTYSEESVEEALEDDKEIEEVEDEGEEIVEEEEVEEEETEETEEAGEESENSGLSR